MSSRSATVLVIFIVACIAFCLATVFASMTGPISILPNQTSGGVLDNLSAITDSDNNYNTYGYDDSNSYQESYSHEDSSSEPQVETTTDDSSQSSSEHSSDESDVETTSAPSSDSSDSQSTSNNHNGDNNRG